MVEGNRGQHFEYDITRKNLNPGVGVQIGGLAIFTETGR